MRTVNQRPSRGGDLLLRKDQGPQHLPRVVGQLGIVQVGGDVGEGPAHIAGDELDELVGPGGEAPHVELVVQEHGGDVRAVEQVLHVVVGAGQLVHLGLQLGVDRLQLLVQGLHLLLGGGQLLVGGLQFLVGGLQLLVGGLELFLGGLHLLAGGLERPRGLAAVPAPARADLRATAARPAGLGVFGRERRRHVREDDHHHPPQRLRLVDSLDGELNGLACRRWSPPCRPLHGDRLVLAHRLVEGAGQF